MVQKLEVGADNKCLSKMKLVGFVDLSHKFEWIRLQPFDCTTFYSRPYASHRRVQKISLQRRTARRTADHDKSWFFLPGTKTLSNFPESVREKKSTPELLLTGGAITLSKRSKSRVKPNGRTNHISMKHKKVVVIIHYFFLIRNYFIWSQGSNWPKN